MFSISCNSNNPNCVCGWHYNKLREQNSFNFNCMDCGVTLKLKPTIHSKAYSKVLWDNHKIKQFIYCCYMCGALYSGYVVSFFDSENYFKIYNYERIYFDVDEVENTIHRQLIDMYKRPMLTANGSGELRIMQINIDDKFEKPKGIPITTEARCNIW